MDDEVDPIRCRGWLAVVVDAAVDDDVVVVSGGLNCEANMSLKYIWFHVFAFQII